MGKVKPNYPIGTPGQSWTALEISQWLQTRKVHRSYHDDVIQPIRSQPLPEFEIVQYGSIDAGDSLNHLPLCAILPRELDSRLDKPFVLITGGTHGYETSGVVGAMTFLSSGRAAKYLPFFNVVVVPCVCPWGYERIERWVSTAVDPNRSFGRGAGDAEPLRTEESSQLIAFLDGLRKKQDEPVQWLCHLDLHETTQSDCTEFRPAKAARDGSDEYDDHVPDGFYLVGDAVGNHLEWYRAILRAVEKVTHIAEVEDGNMLSGYPATSRGLILIPKKEFGLCSGGAVPSAKYLLTTEVYPDSDRTTPDECVKAQLAAVCSALDFILEQEHLLENQSQ